MTLRKYRSLSEAIFELKKRGYTSEFEFKNGKVTTKQDNAVYKTSEVSIVEIHRFNNFKPHVVFVIESVDGKAGYNVIEFEDFTKQNIISLVNSIRIKEGNFLNH